MMLRGMFSEPACCCAVLCCAVLCCAVLCCAVRVLAKYHRTHIYMRQANLPCAFCHDTTMHADAYAPQTVAELAVSGVLCMYVYACVCGCWLQASTRPLRIGSRCARRCYQSTPPSCQGLLCQQASSLVGRADLVGGRMCFSRMLLQIYKPWRVWMWRTR